MSYAHDDTHFHLITIDKHQAISSTMPSGVYTKGIGVSIRDGLDRLLVRMGPLPTGMEKVHAFGEDVVIHKASEHAEKTHEQDNVSSIEECSNNLRGYSETKHENYIGLTHLA
jgi:hypothetical protein